MDHERKDISENFFKINNLYAKIKSGMFTVGTYEMNNEFSL